MTRVAPLKIEINGYKEQLEAAIMDLDGTNMFLGHDRSQLEKWHNQVYKMFRTMYDETQGY